MRGFHLALRASTALAVVTCVHTGAYAQSPEAPADEAVSPEATGDDIIVTAQKRGESINSVPISITAVSGDALRNQGIVDTESLTRVVPGFVVANTYFGSPVYYLRGVGFYDTAIASRPAVSLYADEAPIAFPIMAKGTVLDLERVEVLKGPQGTLFGSNATGGAINFIAAKPTDNFAAGLNLSYGRFNNITADGFVSGPLTQNIKARLAVSKEWMDDWQRGYTTSRTNGSKNVTSGRAVVEFTPTETLTVKVTGSGTIDHSDTIAPQLVGKDLTLTAISPLFTAYPLAPAGSIRAADVGDFFWGGKTTRRDDWAWQLSLRADLEVSDWMTLTSLSSLNRAGQDHGYEADGTTLALTNLSIEGKVRSLFQEFRASGDVGGLRYILGGNYQHDTSDESVIFYAPDSRSGRVFLGLLGPPAVDIVPEKASQKTTSWAVYGNVEYELSPTLKVRGGLRYTETKTDFRGCLQAGGNLKFALGLAQIFNTTPATDLQCITLTQAPNGTYSSGLVENNLDEDNISWRAGVDWTPRKDVLVYGSVSRGYKAGSFSNISAVFASQYDPVPQESVLAYELGAKVQLVPGILRVNGALFYYDYSNKQLLGTVPVPVLVRLSSLVSVPKSHVQGAELDVELRPVTGLSLRVSGTYVETKVDSNFMGNTAFGVPVDLKGASFPNTPKWQGNISLNYTAPISSSLNAFVGANGSYRGASKADFVADPRLAVPSYMLFDTQIGIESADQKWRLQFWTKNLTNKLNYSSVVVRTEAIIRTVGMPRTFGIAASFRY